MNTIAKKSSKLFKEHFGDYMPICALYGFIIICCLAIIYLYFPLFIILVPFVIFPFTYSFACCVDQINGNSFMGIATFFICYKIYYKNIFYGVYRGFLGFIKFIVTVFATSQIGTLILCLTDSSLKELITNAYNTEIFNDSVLLNEYANALMENKYLQLVYLIAVSLGIIVFIHHTLTHSVKLYFNFGKLLVPMRVVNLVHRQNFSKFRSGFYKDYFASIWYLIILFIVGFGLGDFIGFVLLNKDSLVAPIIGLFTGFIFVLVFIPYIFNVLKNIFLEYAIFYSNGFVKLSEDALVELNKMKGMTEENKSEVEEMLNKSKEYFKNESDKDDKDKNEGGLK